MRSTGSLATMALCAGVLLCSGAAGQERGQIKTISKKGERVTLRTNLARGKHTMFEFYADW